MSSKTFQFRLITPQGKILDGLASAVQVPAHDGQLGFEADRAAIVTTLGAGTLSVMLSSTSGKDAAPAGLRRFYVEDGFAQMVNNKLTVLTPKATPAEDLIEGDLRAELAAADAKTSSNPEEMAAISKARHAARAKLQTLQTR